MNKFEDLIEEYKTRSEKEILDYLSRYWNVTPDENGVFTMIGTYKKADHKDKNGNEFAYFEDIRNTEGDILYYPIRKFGKVKLWTACNDKLEKQDIWRISVKLAPKKFREKNPFTLTIANTIFGLPSMNIKDRLVREAQIRKIFKDTGYTERDAKNTVHALHNIMDDLYSNADDRFIYELLQNADDQPEKDKTVSVILQLLKNHILFMHDGRVFDTDDVDSICSIGDSTKRKDKEKIGYKGIGFKSVFTGSDTVIINSGNYSFAFDRFSPIYGDENTNNIPWQLKPIWQERYRYPKEIRDNDTFWKERVGISLEIEENKLIEYRMSIANIFSHPIFLLFLKNIDKIAFNEGEFHTNISKTKDGEILRIERDGEVESSWLIKDYVITIPSDIREALQDDRNVPEKLKESTLTQISFAAKIEDGKISKMNNSVLYAYLPTSVNDFGFPFIVNADFLLAANREQLHVKKIWNQFLFGEIGKLVVSWVASLSRVTPSYLELLSIDQLTEEETGALSLSSFFNKSFVEALGNTAFILDYRNDLVKQDEIIIDKTGLSEIIGAQLFCDVIGTDKKLPNIGVNSSILEKQNIFEQIEVVKLSNISSQLSNSELLQQWVRTHPSEQLSQFFEWLKKNQKGCEELINTLPLFQFEDGFKSRTDIQKDPIRIITTQKNLPIRDILGKLGFKCSIGVFDNHPISELINGQNEKDIFGSISKKLPSDSLSTQDKLSLIKTLVDFSGVGETMISQLALFHNECGEAKPLGEMTRYKESYSTWLNPFMLKQDEFNEELSKYLIDESSVFEKIVSRNYCNIRVSLYEMYQHFSGSWTGQFTRKVIDFYGPNESVLPIVEVSDLQTQQYFLSKIPRIDLKDGDYYNKESFIHRVLMIALSILDDPSSFSQKIFYNGFCIKDFSIKDSVNCEYTSNGENKKVTFSLSRLLPNYQNKSGLIEKVLSLFEPKKGLEKFFDAKSKPNSELYSELNTLLGIPHLMYGPWQPGSGNAQQYLYSVFRRKQVWSVLKGMQIQLEKESNDFIVELLDILSKNNIDIATSPFTYHLKGYFIGKFFDCDYVFVPECILGIVEKWADDPKKKDYLVRNGVRDVSCDAIRFRQLFLENKSTGELGTLLDKDLQSAIEFFAGASSCQRPFTGNYQKELLLKLRVNRQYNLVSQCNLKELASISQEWDGKEYKEWVISHYPKIFFFDGELPMGLFYKDSALIHFREGHHFYDTSSRILYISRDVELEDTLFAIAREGKSGLNLDDYRTLCMSGKVSVSKDEIETKDKQISSLMKDNQEKDELLQRYRAKYGSLDDEVEEEANDSDPNVVTVKKGENEPMSKDKQIDAQIEAQKFLMQVMKSWSFPEGYGETDELGKPYHFSTVVVQDESGTSIPIVLKSYKKISEPFKINTEEWDWIIKEEADLLIYDGSDIKRHDINDLVRNQANVSITFSTENLDIEERISAFSDSLHYFNELHFDFDSFNISKKAKSVKDIYNTNIGAQNNFSDEEAL